MSGAHAESRGRLIASALLTVIGVVALLDLTTSAIPSFTDVFEPVPTWPLWARGLELLVAAPLVRFVPPGARAAITVVRSLPGSSWGKALLGVYVVGVLVVVAFRTEAYPFSNVGMFSAVPAEVDTTTPRSEPSIVFVRGEAIVPVPTLREGSALVARLDSDWDYKTGWVLYMFGASDSHALERADAVARANGYDRAARANVVFDPRSGHVLRVEPYTTEAP